MDVHVGHKYGLLGHVTVVFMGTQEGGQAEDGKMTRVVTTRGISADEHEELGSSITAAHEKLSPDGN